MKTTLTIIALLIGMVGNAQKTLNEQYIDWCNADSNAFIIGWVFILAEGKNNCGGWSSQYEVFDANYAPKDRNYIKFMSVDFSDPKTVYYYWEKQQKRENTKYFVSQKYIRAEPIKKNIEPTFEGFEKWKKDKLKINFLFPDYVADLLEYQRQCYNDSVYGLVYPEQPKHGNGTLAIWIESWYEWTHKQPTFEGFIEFVTKKYESK